MARQTAYSQSVATPDVGEDEDEYGWDDAEPADPRWPWLIGLILCGLGLGVSIYLTYAHYSATPLDACPDKGIINCAKVTTSVYSHILGVPVAVLGLVFFVGMIPLQLPAAWRSRWWPIRYGRLGASVIGVGMILWLVYAELFKLDSICLYCTSVHVLTFLLFVVVALGTVATASHEPV
jgi:uncharacterized membrane protein